MRSVACGLLFAIAAACGSTAPAVQHPDGQRPDGQRPDGQQPVAKPVPPPPDCTNCSAELPDTQQYVPPDSDHGPPTPPPTAKSPEATCELVGETLAIQELGNYADADVLRDEITKQTARCRTYALTPDERGCLLEAGKQTTLQAYCAPRLYPAIPIQIATKRECDELVSDFRTKRAGTRPAPTAQQTRVWNAKMAVVAESCAKDRWPVSMFECTRANSMVEEPLRYCTSVAPKMLQNKIAARLTKALADAR